MAFLSKDAHYCSSTLRKISRKRNGKFSGNFWVYFGSAKAIIFSRIQLCHFLALMGPFFEKIWTKKMKGHAYFYRYTCMSVFWTCLYNAPCTPWFIPKHLCFIRHSHSPLTRLDITHQFLSWTHLKILRKTNAVEWSSLR